MRIGDIYAERSERGAEDMELLSVTMNDGVKMRSDIEGKDNSSEDKSNYKIVRVGDMVYNSMRMWQGANGISPWDGIVSPAYTVLKPRMPISNGFFAALFKTHRLINEFRKNSQGMTSDTWNLKYPQIETIKTCIPALAEQEKIADCLMALDQRIEKQRTLVEHLKKYKRGLSESIFSSLLCPTQELSKVCDIIGGGTPDTGVLEYWNGEIYWFTPTEVGKKKYVVSSSRTITNEGLIKSSAKMLPPQTVLLTTRATLGEMSITTTACCTNQGFQSLVAKKDVVLPEYLYYLQTIIKPWCEKYSSGNTFREISKSALGKCAVPVPSIKEQTRIVDCLSLVDTKIENCELVLENLTTMKSALVQCLFI